MHANVCNVCLLDCWRFHSHQDTLHSKGSWNNFTWSNLEIYVNFMCDHQQLIMILKNQSWANIFHQSSLWSCVEVRHDWLLTVSIILYSRGRKRAVEDFNLFAVDAIHSETQEEDQIPMPIIIYFQSVSWFLLVGNHCSNIFVIKKKECTGNKHSEETVFRNYRMDESMQVFQVKDSLYKQVWGGQNITK